MFPRVLPRSTASVLLTGFLGFSPLSASEETKVLEDPSGNKYPPVLAGAFQMGDAAEKDTPLHPVSVQSFHAGATEVTYQEWKNVLTWAKQNGYEFTRKGSGMAEDHPVTDVSWYDAVKWCNAKSEMESLKPCYYTAASKTPAQVYKKGKTDLSLTMVDWDASGYRLPTEAEWEKAARGGLQGKKYPHGDIIGRSDANFSGSSTKPAGSYDANGFGIHDMAGNVLEWCWDWYDNNSYTSSAPTDPRGAQSGTQRVTRGGSWYGNAGSCRVSRRDCSPPDQVVGSLGFRVVRK